MTTTHADIQNLSNEDVNRLIGKAVLKHVAIKVGLALAVHVAVRQIIKSIED